MDFGAGQGATRSADIRSDLGPASNEGQRQNQRNSGGREAEGQLAASLVRYSPLRGCASFAPCHPPFCLYARPTPVFQQSPRPGSDGCFKLWIPASKHSFSGSRSSRYTKKKATADYADMTHYKARDWHAFLIAPTAIKVSRKKFHVP